ncbi:hypothetical protein [Microbacterium sp.]|uniref:hypothetical protein n=1 Tax=Microbacterium sp. TaxID=51671 RepID=UPI0039E59374
MTSPKPVALTQVAAGDYTGPEPQPLVVVGPVPGGGGGGGGAVTWGDVTGKPATFPPDAHTHLASDITNFTATVNSRIAASTEIVKTTGDQAVAGVKTFTATPVVPDGSFAVAKTAGLQAALDAKAPATRTVAGHPLTADVPRAGLSTVGVGEAVFIPNGGTVPAGTPAYTIVIEAAA